MSACRRARVTIIGRSNGAAVKVIVANSNKFEASMVVRDNVKDMADLKGKRIGIQQPGGFADLLSRSVLRAAKIDPKDVNFVTIASEDVPALVADQVDTAILHVEQEMLAKSKVPTLHAIARMWEVQPKTLYTLAVVTEKTIKDKPAALQAFVTANIEAMRMMYSDKAKVMPILVKFTGYPEKIMSETYDFMVKNCIWDANTGLGPERVQFHRRADDQGRQHQGRQDAEIRRCRRHAVRARRRSSSSANGKGRCARRRRSKVSKAGGRGRSTTASAGCHKAELNGSAASKERI